MEELPLQSLTITQVSYDPSSRIQLVSAFLALVPQALMVVYVTLIYSTREIEVLLMFLGQLACEGLNWILKQHLRENRPTDFIGKGYGMPSSHAQFMAYWSTYLMLFVLIRHDPLKPNTSSTHIATPRWVRGIIGFSGIILALAVARSRV